MAMTLNQKLATRLAAPGGALSADQERLYVVRIEGDEDEGYYLSDRCTTNMSTLSETSFAPDVRPNTSVAYLLSPSASDETDERLACFYINKFNNLRLAMFNPDPDESRREPDEDSEDEEAEGWVDVDFDGVQPPSVHPNGQVSACFTADGALAFFQDVSGAIQSLQQKDAEWSRLAPLPVSARAGSPHCPRVIDSELHFFYTSEDGNLHHATRKIDGTQWTDMPFENNRAGEHASRLTVGYDPEAGKLTAYVLANDTLTAIGQEGSQQDLVRKEGRRFVAVTGAECGFIAVGVSIPFVRFAFKMSFSSFRGRCRGRRGYF